MRLQRLIFVLILMGVAATTAPTPTPAQRLEFNEFHTWSDIATIYNYTDRFRYDGDYGIRGLLTDRDWTLVYLRPSVRYRSAPWLSLHGGVALFYNFLTGEDLPELRPWVGLRFVGPRPRGWIISNYFRLELRAFYLKSADTWEETWRGRWQLQVRSPDFEIGDAERFYALTSIELFEEFVALDSLIDGTFGDRFRFVIGMGKRVSQSLRVELDYLFHGIRLASAEGSLEVDDHVVRLRLFYSLN